MHRTEVSDAGRLSRTRALRRRIDKEMESTRGALAVRRRVARLVWEARPLLALGVVTFVLLEGLLPPLALVALGWATGHIPAAVRSGLGSPAGHALLWSLMGYYALGFLVQLAIDEHAGVGEAFRSATVGGQVGVGIATLFALLKLEPARFLHTPRVVTWAVSFVAGAYLLGLEAALMAISHGGHVYAGRLGIVAIAVAGYLPVRLYLAVALEGHKWDLVAMALAFAHFVWRIVT